MPQPISMAKIEEMFSAYADTPSASHVSRVCGVDKRTAQKYIAEGDPARGIEPFVQRVKRVTRLAARRVEKKIAYRKADAHAAAWEHLQLLDDCITEALLDIREKMAERNPKIHEAAKAVQISVALKTQLKRWAEEDGDSNSPDDFFQGWTEDQIEAFIEHGTVPDTPGQPEPSTQKPAQPHTQGKAGVQGASRGAGAAPLQPPSRPSPEALSTSEVPPAAPDPQQQPPETPLPGAAGAPTAADQPPEGTSTPGGEPEALVPAWLEPEE